MRNLFNGGFGFLLCLLIGILVDQVALGIIGGIFLGAILGSVTPNAPGDDKDA